MRISRLRRILLIAVGAVLVLWVGASAWVAHRFTQRARSPFAEPAPRATWGRIEDLRLRTADGEELGAWLVRGSARRGGVVLLHGIGGSRGEMLQIMQWLAEAQFTVLAVSQRSHGDSTGAACDFGWSNRHDVVAAVECLERECPKRPIYVVGHSMGAAAAIFAAGELGDRVAGYLLAQPYKDLSTATWNRLHRRLPVVLDWVAYGGLRVCSGLFLPVAPSRISPCDRAADIPESVPIVFMNGSADEHARLEEVAAVQGRVASHAQLIVFDGAAHEPLDRRDPTLYQGALFELVGMKDATTMAGLKHNP